MIPDPWPWCMCTWCIYLDPISLIPYPWSLILMFVCMMHVFMMHIYPWSLIPILDPDLWSWSLIHSAPKHEFLMQHIFTWRSSSSRRISPDIFSVGGAAAAGANKGILGVGCIFLRSLILIHVSLMHVCMMPLSMMRLKFCYGRTNGRTSRF